MRTAILLLSVVSFCSAQDAKVPAAKVASESGPRPIPVDRHEEISKKMLAAQAAQLNAIQTREEAQKAVEKAVKMAEDSLKQYEALRSALQKEFGAEGCNLSLEKIWVDCPVKK